ncbi:MAG: YbaN family protein [Lysobacterales bacterium]
MTRFLWALLAWVSLILGIIGAVLPVMPTVPFILLSAFAATRGSDRLRGWLVAHPTFGRAILDWEQNGAVTRKAKWIASAMMSISSPSMAYFAPRPWMAAIGIGCMALVTLWLWCRPEPRQPPEPPLHCTDD